MTGSRKRTPIVGMTMAESEKDFKRQEHRRERRAVHASLKTEVEVVPDPRQYGNPWAGPKDGRQFLKSPEPRHLRK